MRTAFLDSSVIVKVYAWEPGSDRVRALLRSAILDNPPVTLVVCDLAVPEACCALARKESEGTISHEQADLYFTRMLEHFFGDERPYMVVQASTVMAHVAPLSRKYTLRGMDSVQLAAAFVAKERAPLGTDFSVYCADGRLSRAAQAADLQVVNPLPEVPAKGSA